ncbi:MAG: hypothetical protein HY426_00705 [Candidatus Levybacteria bacterium]|nr:hypothetical protein [Candidatus Levybacteria bacterium]
MGSHETIGISEPNIYDDYPDGIGENPGVDHIAGTLEPIRDKAVKTPEDLEEAVHEGHLGAKVQSLLDGGLAVGAMLKSSGEVTLIVAKHKRLIAGAATAALGVTTAAGVLILHRKSKK